MTLTNEVVEVDIKTAHTNFTAEVDDPAVDAAIIWLSNLVLGKLVMARKTFKQAAQDRKPRTPESARLGAF